MIPTTMPVVAAAGQSQNNRNYSTLYIGDLEEQITEEMLYSVFIKYGPIFSLRIMKDFNTKKSRGFGFVSYYNVSDAKNAKQSSNHTVILTRPIRITWKKSLKELQGELNLFVKNVPAETTEQDFENLFKDFGAIFSSKLSLDEHGKCRGYGYVQFEDKESAEKALAQKTLEFKGATMELGPFQTKAQRPEMHSNNLYIKNLPSIAADQAQEQLMKLGSKYGEVTSLLVREDAGKRLFAFMCYKTHDEAEKAHSNLQNSDPFQMGSNLYVNWAQKKSDRLRQLKNLYQNNKNETNIFSRNIKNTVTQQQLHEAFSVFGEIQNCEVRDPQNAKYQTLMAFINYNTKESALACLMGAQTSEKIKQLYANEKVYVNLHVPKTQYMSFDRMRSRIQAPMMDPMQMIKQMQMMMGGAAGGNPQQAPMPFMNMMPNFMNMMPNMMNMMPTARGGRNLPPRNMPGMPKSQGQQPKKAAEVKKFATVADIRNNLSEFTKLDQDKQRSYLGEILFPMVREIIQNKDDVPRVTGMLVDFEVFELTDILEILESKSQLTERVEEAEQLINEERGAQQ